MDARPFRPRGAENRPQLMHQRHKSTGNIAALISAQNGFRGPAKRAAFGDITNVTEASVKGRSDGKALKPQASAIGLVQPLATTIYRENASDRIHSRPAQRPSGVTPKPSTIEPAGLPLSTLAPLQEVDVNHRPSTNDGTFRPQPAAAPEELPSLSSQPRHYKSQPQLKQPQPVLRRTQSRQLETATVLEETTQEVAADYLAMPSSATISESDNGASAANWEVLEPNSHHTLDTEDEYAQQEPKLSEINDDSGTVPIAFKDGPTGSLSEPEEYWDQEEDEEYDDQDQAYTTAHSFRSQNLTVGGATTLLAPRITSKVQRELEDARLDVEATRPGDFEEEIWDVSMVAEYGDEIFAYMRELEIKLLPNPHYMDIQTEIQWSMRSVLMDWLVQVHMRFGLLPETLFLTVNYIDRFLSSKVVSIGKLQLVGATAILVASKYEEINCPSLQEIVYMVDKGYTTDEILKAERFMLSMLSFELGWPGPMSFLRRVSKADDYDLETRTLAKYFLELTIMDERFVASPPSFLAAGAHCLSRLILKKGDWTKAHVHYSGYTWSQLKSLVTLMLGCCEQPRLHHQAVFEKYSEKRFKEASLIVQDALDAGFSLPYSSRPSRKHYATSPLEDPSDLLFTNAQLVPIEG